MDSRRAYISLGSNVGRAEQNLEIALQHIIELDELNLIRKSQIYKTEPQEDSAQEFFFNQVICVSYTEKWTAESFLQALLCIEEKMGRTREASRRYGPRIIDLDLLLFGHVEKEDAFLHLPHPKMFERAFILVPLLEISPEFISFQGIKAKEALSLLNYKVENGIIYQTTK